MAKDKNVLLEKEFKSPANSNEPFVFEVKEAHQFKAISVSIDWKSKNPVDLDLTVTRSDGAHLDRSGEGVNHKQIVSMPDNPIGEWTAVVTNGHAKRGALGTIRVTVAE